MPYQIADKTKPVADMLNWVNMYSPMDPVSARLVYYTDVQEHRRWFLLWGGCHMSYWHDAKFYRQVLTALGLAAALTRATQSINATGTAAEVFQEGGGIRSLRFWRRWLRVDNRQNVGGG
jgi:hypothetical protein